MLTNEKKNYFLEKVANEIIGNFINCYININPESLTVKYSPELYKDDFLEEISIRHEELNELSKEDIDEIEADREFLSSDLTAYINFVISEIFKPVDKKRDKFVLSVKLNCYKDLFLLTYDVHIVTNLQKCTEFKHDLIWNYNNTIPLFAKPKQYTEDDMCAHCEHSCVTIIEDGTMDGCATRICLYNYPNAKSPYTCYTARTHEDLCGKDHKYYAKRIKSI